MQQALFESEVVIFSTTSPLALFPVFVPWSLLSLAASHQLSK